MASPLTYGDLRKLAKFCGLTTRKTGSLGDKCLIEERHRLWQPDIDATQCMELLRCVCVEPISILIEYLPPPNKVRVEVLRNGYVGSVGSASANGLQEAVCLAVMDYISSA